MAIRTTSTYTTISDDATFRSLVTEIRDALEDIGAIRLTGIGEIDPTTALRPAANAYAGYDVFRFADTLQATHPVFFKVEYGMTASGTIIQLRFTLGTGHTGGGNLSDASPTMQIRPQTATAVAQAGYASGEQLDIGMVNAWFGMGSSTLGYGFGFTIERGRADDGSVDGNLLYVMLLGEGTSGSAYQHFALPRGATTLPTFRSTSSARMAFPDLTVHGSRLSGADFAVAPGVLLQGRVKPPPVHAVGVLAADAAGGSEFEITRYSVARTYKVCAPFTTQFNLEALASSGVAIYWE